VVDDPNQTLEAYHVVSERARNYPSRVYTQRASAAVSLVDASGVVTSAIMACRNARPSFHHDGRRVYIGAPLIDQSKRTTWRS
jgi:hypothetical protein